MDGDAIPPSSPPHLGSISPQSPPFFEPQHNAFTSKSSSPPPLFSSDDSRESVDVTNYESPRIHKNKRKGAWWDNRESAHNSPEVKKPKFSRNLDRNFDSGVYMLSDATDSSDDLLPQHKSPFPDEMEYTHDHAIDMNVSHTQAMQVDTSSCPALAATPAICKVIMSAAERAFNRQLDEGLDRDQETYDFEGQGLYDSDITRIGELRFVIKDPLVNDSEAPAEGQFRSFEPEIHLNLNKNRLRRLVPSLFSVTCLNSLALRENEIEELPQDIRRLESLEELYVSQNKLKYLPFDVVNLLWPYGNLGRLTTMGSDLLEPMTSKRFHTRAPGEEVYTQHLDKGSYDLDSLRQHARSQLVHLYESLPTCIDRDSTVWRIRYFESWATCFSSGPDSKQDMGFYPHHPSLHVRDIDSDVLLVYLPRYIARTLVSYYDQTGSLLRGSPSLPASDYEKYPVIVETLRGTYGVPSSAWFAPPEHSKVPSLLTATLTRSLQTDTTSDLRKMISNNGEYEIPRAAEKILTQADRTAEGGYSVFRECHACHKQYVVARAEWIEFWSNGNGYFHPFKVSVCSWGCVPQQMMQRPEKELTW
ncbi:hypothetical protein COCC4DRAFT_136434 [Bipolaris maydis ATCC 48331]|uniref:Uncharacterized protein n=2 Tax=Cochliobolus heterostrophus TaxID=5016 RepID=M2UTI8_COCH5|nr:uncharacterized protein COCC4DRAFT_136434 [Bipolaris maydis ATCC 48331]EMD91187.1 hypothetical protein COCHEDRAFT_1177094 [Bipolaris maydis C5]KAJ5022883.1 hypothetical protein J3E73DRAFT_385095 [Bipolaris maydis]ENI05732.1 hypothetical protein COCC4DRAFT_136434 [Bipolaris maydis ATCC 48331]KAJ5064431.1 hypothetical protein J3E74DRAFT_415467 [Bipolaris maydis]KAJ6205035.1 hypothetical protein PSV09DRAFT_1177094 [Bipolaris maydis]